MSVERQVEPTELVAGRWALRPWPAAFADLDDRLAERYGSEQRADEHRRRIEGWARGTYLGFAVREITTGWSVAEVAVVMGHGREARVDSWVSPGHEPTDVAPAVEAVVRRWATGALGLTLD